MMHGVEMMGKGNRLTMDMNKGEFSDNDPGFQEKKTAGIEMRSPWHV